MFLLCNKKITFWGFVLMLYVPGTDMVMVRQSVHLTTLFLGKLEQAVSQYFVHIPLFVADNNLS